MNSKIGRSSCATGWNRPPPSEKKGEELEVYDDALSALLNLGYPVKSAKRAVDKAYHSESSPDLEGLIKDALKILA